MKRRRTASFGFNPMNVGWLKQQPHRAPEPEKEQEDD